MRWAFVLWIAAGCQQVFGLEAPQLADAARVGDASDGSSGLTCIERWLAGPRFSPPLPLAGVNGSDSEANPFVTSDGETLYFNRNNDIFIATRAGPMTFSAGTQVPNLSSPSDEGRVFVTDGDGRAFFVSNRPGGAGGHDFWRGTRADSNAPWSVDQMYLGVINDAGHQYDPHLSKDLLRMYFAPKYIDQDIVVSTRTGTSTAFGSPRPVLSLSSSSDEHDPSLTGDERVIVFVSERNGSNDLFYATRPDASDEFGPPQELGSLNTSFIETGTHVSADGCTLYFDSDRSQGGSRDIYVTTLLD